MKFAFFLLPLALAAPIADIANAPSAEERAVAPAQPEVEGRQLLGGVTGLLGGLLGGLGSPLNLNGNVLNLLTSNLGQSLQPLPLSQVYSLVSLVQGVVAGNGVLPKVLPTGLPTSLSNAQFDAFIYNTQQILKGVPGMPAGLIGSLGTILGKVVPVSGGGGAAPPGSTDLGVGLTSLVGQAVRLITGFNPAASPDVIGQNLGQLDALLKKILAALPTSSAGVDVGGLTSGLGQLVNNLSAYLGELQNPTNPLILQPGQGVVSSLGGILRGLAVVNGLNNVVANLAGQIKLGGNNNLNRLLARAIATALQLVQGLLQTLGLGNVAAQLLGSLGIGSGGGLLGLGL
ncbi:hypothetical protein Q8F55_004373 [Vanrija albida]|uniref:Bacterial collagen-like protein middle domain-containing protein n=1 Tax=Vanrija albida TaxID=181172 RepID=A0ABR3Q6J2_9TREE